MYLKMHYYIKFIMFFFRVFIIMYLKNALLDMCYFLIFSHIYIIPCFKKDGTGLQKSSNGSARRLTTIQ